MEIIAHRGASKDAPENTMAAFNLAWQQKADAVELDIWQSKDGKIVVMHDGNTKRTAGFDGKISEQTWDELRARDAGSWKGTTWKGEKIPLLDEVLPTIPADKRLYIEIKCGPEVLPELERVIGASGKASQLVIIGFGYETMRQAKQLFPKIPVFFLSGFLNGTPSIPSLIEKAKAAQLDGLDLLHSGPLDAEAVRQIKDAGLKVCVWTVDNDEAAKRLLAAGVEAFTTNRPQWLREQLTP